MSCGNYNYGWDGGCGCAGTVQYAAPACNPNFPTTCFPLGATTQGVRVVVEDEQSCKWTLANPVGTSTTQYLTLNPLTSALTWTPFNYNPYNYINVVNYGADQTGTLDSSPAFASAIAAIVTNQGTIYVPPGTYKLTTNVSIGSKSVSFNIDTGAFFTGAGNITGATYGPQYIPNLISTPLTVVKGTANAAAPIGGAMVVGVKYANSSEYSPSDAYHTSTSQNPVVYGAGYKNSTYANARIQGVVGEATDNVGGNGSFVEGGRFQGYNVSTGGAGEVTGVVAYAQSNNNSGATYVIGAEAEVARIGYDAPSVTIPYTNFFNNSLFATCFLATSRTSNKPDSGYMVNPYNSQPPQCGYLIPPDAPDSLGGGQAVNSVGFGCYNTKPISYGIDLTGGHFNQAAIVLANGANGVIKALNSTGTPKNILYLNSSNGLRLGDEASATSVSNFFVTNTTAIAGIYVGNGTPAGTVTANPGSIYLNTAGGSGTTLYVKESGTGTSSGWVGK